MWAKEKSLENTDNCPEMKNEHSSKDIKETKYY